MAERRSENGGQKLRRIRERLNLRYRDVAEASERIASEHGNDDFAIGLSRLADIENKGTIPSLFRLYSLCAIYRVDFNDALQWYGVDLRSIPVEAAKVGLPGSHLTHFRQQVTSTGNSSALQDGADPAETTLLTKMVRRWGALPLCVIEQGNSHQYGFIGSEDWSMFPILRPGSLVIIKDVRKIANGGWQNEHDRPVYFFELRNGYACAWATLLGDRLVLESHPASLRRPRLYRYPQEIDLVGRVVGVAMPLGVAPERKVLQGRAERNGAD
ncbi:MAG: hypothetical protein C5B51_08355 [Terriglobia bacterium]|nr:MAG: hypothetical protein C5B51_08355 [Terriglobia bacterium]